MTFKTIISEYGQSHLAKQLRVPASQVHHWVQGIKPVPIKYCQSIKERVNGVTLQMLRPNDWQAVWPELAKPDLAHLQPKVDVILQSGDAVGYVGEGVHG